MIETMSMFGFSFNLISMSQFMYAGGILTMHEINKLLAQFIFGSKSSTRIIFKKFYSSIGNGIKASKSKYPCPFVIAYT
jgi:hypothetical protein